MARVVDITLRADATGFIQSVGRAKDAVGELGGKVAESTRSQRQEWATVGTAMSGVGLAITGVGAAALKTGMQYNTLQQTSRAALTTILGSARAANEQMDKLDDFARNSPFAKQTFITAQQQMLAFGIEARKVLPYLDAIQNAVAASGGSNADIAELSEIFGKIQSSAKITAIDLQQFGRRGINAAELIGQAMGKTGAEIRSEITAGTLDASQAIQALADGMATQFDGAAANVKNTFDGAMDRVKAAWRDFASELATPLVDPNGGGALVDLLNHIADAMRAFERLPAPVKTTVSTLTGAVGGVALMGGTLMLAIPKVVAFRDALKDLNLTAGRAESALAGIAPALLAIAAVQVGANVADWIDNFREVKLNADELNTSLKETGSGLDEMKRALTGGNSLSSIFGDEVALNNLRALNTEVGKIAGWAQNTAAAKALSVATLGIGRELGHTAENLSALDREMAAHVAAGRTEDATSLYRDLAGILKEAGYEQEDITRVLPEYTAAQKAASEATREAGETATQATEGFDEMGNSAGMHVRSLLEIQRAAYEVNDAILSLSDELAGFGSVQLDANSASMSFYKALDDLQLRLNDGKVGLNLATEAGRENQKTLDAVAQAANKSAAATLEATGSQEAANAVLEEARERLVAAAEQYGMSEEAARQYVDQVLATPESVETYMKLHTSAAEAELQSFIDRNSGRTITINANLNERVAGANSMGGLTYAHGGTVGYAHGGTIPGAANGMTIGLGGGVAGGTVFGAGTAKSDSVLVRLSKGEEVIQEPYASQNRDLLKAINRGEFHQGMMQPQMGGSTSTVKNYFDVNVNVPPGVNPAEIAALIDDHIRFLYGGG